MKLLTACGVEGQRELVQTVKRPDGAIEAIVVLHSGGGAAGWVYWSVDLIDTVGQQRQGVAKISHGEQPKLSWSNDSLLKLHVPCGHIREFTNVFQVARAETFATIEIALESGGPCKSS
jgi:hypothetical protein